MSDDQSSQENNMEIDLQTSLDPVKGGKNANSRYTEIEDKFKQEHKILRIDIVSLRTGFGEFD